MSHHTDGTGTYREDFGGHLIMSYHETLTSIVMLIQTLNRTHAGAQHEGRRPWMSGPDSPDCCGLLNDAGLYGLLRHLGGDELADHYEDSHELRLELADRNAIANGN